MKTGGSMIVIGLTGLSGSGKGVVASILKKCGAFVFDCDEIAHSNMAKGGCAYADIVEYFGEDILNTEKEIDRKVEEIYLTVIHVNPMIIDK